MQNKGIGFRMPLGFYPCLYISKFLCNIQHVAYCLSNSIPFDNNCIDLKFLIQRKNLKFLGRYCHGKQIAKILKKCCRGNCRNLTQIVIRLPRNVRAEAMFCLKLEIDWIWLSSVFDHTNFSDTEIEKLLKYLNQDKLILQRINRGPWMKKVNIFKYSVYKLFYMYNLYFIFSPNVSATG